MAELIEGAVNIQLSEESLANIGRTALYEGFAKTALSVSLKALRQLSHDDWVGVDKKPFKWIVDEIHKELDRFPQLKAHFEAIYKSHDRWRDKRNMIIHSPWGQSELGKSLAYCYRRKIRADENDIIGAVNDCFWLAKEARSFQYQVAILIANGEINESSEDGPGILMSTPAGSVRF